MPRKTDEEVKKELEAELQRRQEAAKKAADQLKARLRAIDGRMDAKKRKADTRRKTVMGALVLKHAQTNPDFRAVLARLVASTIDRDKALFPEFLPPAG